jgi:hypothetical protein
VSAAEEIRAQALEVAAGWSPDGAPESWRLTASLFGAIAAHEELPGRLARLPAGRLPALLGHRGHLVPGPPGPAGAAGHLFPPARRTTARRYPVRLVAGDVLSALPAVLDGFRPAAGSSSPTRTYDGSVESSRLLARAHPSGEWVEWLA